MRISDWSSDVCSSDLDSVPAFLEALKLLHTLGPLDGFAISSMSCSGGEASVMADAAEGPRVTYRALTAGHARAVKATLGPPVTVANPPAYHPFICAHDPALSPHSSARVPTGFDLHTLPPAFPRAERRS